MKAEWGAKQFDCQLDRHGTAIDAASSACSNDAPWVCMDRNRLRAHPSPVRAPPVMWSQYSTRSRESGNPESGQGWRGELGRGWPHNCLRDEDGGEVLARDHHS